MGHGRQFSPAVIQLPRAKEGDYGREYCGVIYSLGDGVYYASHPSRLTDLRLGFVSPIKNCYVPREVRDSRGQSVLLGDYQYERRGKQWKLIGLIKPEDKATGVITLVDD